MGGSYEFLKDGGMGGRNLDARAQSFYFGPKAPRGKDANWLQTVPGKGRFCLLRLYSPTEDWFEKTWRPGEIELVE